MPKRQKAEIEAEVSGLSGVVHPKLIPDLLVPAEHVRQKALWILSGVVVAIIVMSGLAMISGDTQRWGEAREYLEITFVPLIGLLGAAVGYYFSPK